METQYFTYYPATGRVVRNDGRETEVGCVPKYVPRSGRWRRAYAVSKVCERVLYALLVCGLALLFGLAVCGWLMQ